MIGLLFGMALVVAVVAAARSTWSPCGLSMLSSINPVTARARGHRFGWVASWYALGAGLGGLSLGLLASLGAFAVRAGLPMPARGLLASLLAALAVAADLQPHGKGHAFPLIRRQLDERWLEGYRPWVYASGFGWQVGTGLATYVMTAAVFLVPALGALTGSPVLALVVGTVFGAARGLAILTTSAARSSDRLLAFHRRFDALGEPVRRVVIGVCAAVSVLAAASVATAWALLASVAMGAAAGLAGLAPTRRRSTRQGPAAVAAGGWREAAGRSE